MDILKFLVDDSVMGLLAVMSVVSLAIAIERWRAYRAIQPDTFSDKRVLELSLTHRLHWLATIAGSAPYIGLLGTVLGIMFTFQTIGREGLFDTGAIMTGLSMALKATVMGLVVAIPAVFFYNALLRQVRVILTQWEIHHGRQSV